jgi:transposase
VCRVKVRDKIWVGIDVGKSAHHACAVDEKGPVVFSQQVSNGQAAVEALIARAGKAGTEVVWAVDMTSGIAGLLLTLLLGSGAPVLYVPGRLVNRMAGAFAGEGKTDPKDAKTIAETARLRTDLVPVTSPDQIVADLQVLTARREDLMADWVRGVNRIRDLLASVFPSLERAFDYSSRSPLILLTGYQTPTGLREAGADGVRGYLVEHGAWAKGIPVIADKAIAAATEQTVTLPGEGVTAPLIARLAAELLELDRQIKDLDKQLTERFGQHRHAKPITSIPGFGPILGAQLLADTGGDLHTAFGSPGRLAAYAGLAPVPRDSGRVKGNLHRPKRYHRRLRRVFYMAALSSIKPDGPSRTFYQRKRAEGKIHTRPSSRSPAASSTSFGHCCATSANSSPQHRSKRQQRLDTIIETPRACVRSAPT